jgi:hypothetical protein
MRTTIYIDDHLMTRVKEVAARTGKTMTAVIEDAIRQSLEDKHPRERKRIRLTTVGGKGPRKGVDLDDTASILELMERHK